MDSPHADPDRHRRLPRRPGRRVRAVARPARRTTSTTPSARPSALADGLFPHQIEGVAFLLGRRRAILADDMGLGKTRQAIVSLRHAAPGGPYPRRLPRLGEAQLGARDRRRSRRRRPIRVLEGGTAAPERFPNGRSSTTTSSSKHLEALGRVPWAGLVFDEAHYLKNHTSARSQRRAPARGQAATNGDVGQPAVYLLTGTPLTNRPRDLFVLLQLVGHSLGRSFLSFAKRYCAAEKNDFGWKTDGASNLEELTVQLHGVMLRRSKDAGAGAAAEAADLAAGRCAGRHGRARDPRGGGPPAPEHRPGRRWRRGRSAGPRTHRAAGAPDEGAPEARRREGRRDRSTSCREPSIRARR